MPALCSRRRPLGAPIDSDRARAWIGDLEPLAEAEFGYEQAAHLLERTGFGGTPAQIEELVSLGLEGAVARLVDYEQVDDSDLPPFDESGIWDPGMDPFPASRAQAVRIGRRDGRALGVDVLAEGSSRPLQPVGRQVLLRSAQQRAGNAAAGVVVGQAHGDDAAAARREDDPLLARPLRHLGGQGPRRPQDAPAEPDPACPTRTAISAVWCSRFMRDPAMLVYLDNRENVKDHPNENFGRELLELFTMGLNNLGNASNYTEQDIREASRAFTGWTNDVLDFRFDAELHDDGAKTFLGREGNLGGEEVLGHHPRAAGHRRVHRRQALPLPGARGLGARAASGTGSAPAGIRIRVEGSAAHDPLVADFYSPAVGRDADQESGPVGRLDLPQARRPDRADGAGT